MRLGSSAPLSSLTAPETGWRLRWGEGGGGCGHVGGEPGAPHRRPDAVREGFTAPVSSQVYAVIYVGGRVTEDVLAELVEIVKGADGDLLIVLGSSGGVSQDKVTVLGEVFEPDTVSSGGGLHNHDVLESFVLL